MNEKQSLLNKVAKNLAPLWKAEFVSDDIG